MRRCLNRDRKDRLHDAADAPLDLDEAIGGENLEPLLEADSPAAITKTQSFLTVVERNGESKRLALGPRGLQHPRFSPTGDQIAFTAGEAVDLPSASFLRAWRALSRIPGAQMAPW